MIERAPLIVFRNFDGIQSLEDKLLLNGGFDTPEISAAADLVLARVFSLSEADFKKRRYLPSFGLDEVDDFDLSSWFEESGYDMKDREGRLLRCARIVGSTIFHVADGSIGRMPSVVEVQGMNWESDLARAAKEFQSRKRGY